MSLQLATPDIEHLQNQIQSYIQNDRQVDEFNKARLLRDIDKLSADFEFTKDVLKSMLYSAANERELTMEYAVKSLQYPYDQVSINNALISLLKVGYPHMAFMLVKKLQSTVEELNFVGFMNCLNCVPDIDLLEQGLNILRKTDLNSNYPLEFEFSSQKMSTFHKANERFSVTRKDINQISQLAALIAESSKAEIDFCRFEILPENDWLSIVFRLKKHDIENAVNMNIELADLLIDEGLDRSSIVVRFEVF